jgi:hypothetical protein
VIRAAWDRNVKGTLAQNGAPLWNLQPKNMENQASRVLALIDSLTASKIGQSICDCQSLKHRCDEVFDALIQ